MSGRREDGGQAAVELALVLPMVCTLLLAVVQVALVVHAQLLVVHAAREGARVERMLRELRAWQKKVGAKFPTANPAYDAAKPDGRGARRL